MTTVTKTNAAEACTHPLGLSTKQMARLDAGGTVPLGSMSVNSTIQRQTTVVGGTTSQDGYTRTDSATASFPLLDGSAIAGRAGYTLPGMSVTPTLPERSGDFTPVFESVQEMLDAGSQLTLKNGGNLVNLGESGSAGFTTYRTAIPATSPVSDASLLSPSALIGGNWTVAGTGGADIAAFSRSVHIAPAIRLKSVPALIDTKSDQVFEWDPTGYTDADSVMLSLAVFTLRNPFGFPTVGRSVGGTVPARSGRAVLAAAQMASLAADISGPTTQGTVTVSVSRPAGQSFSVPLTSGETFPVRFDYSSSETVSVLLR